MNDDLFYEATSGGQVDLVKSLLAKGGNCNEVDEYGNSLLHIAAKKGYLEIAKCLIMNGANLNATNFSGRHTPLYEAAIHGHLDIVQFLVKNGAAIDLKDDFSSTPLHEVARSGDLEMVKCLLASGANPNSPNGYGNTPFHEAAQYGQLAILKTLCKSGVDIHAVNNLGNTPLQLAVRNNQLEVIQYLLENGTKQDLFVADKNGWTPLHDAVYNKNLKMVRYLMEKGANLNAKTKNGETTLKLAKIKENEEIVNYLNTFKKPLSHHLSHDNFCLIRVWAPIDKDKEVSYPYVLFNWLKGNSTPNIGHVSIAIFKKNEKIYASHWPDVTPRYFKSVVGCNRTLSNDLSNEGEGRYPSSYIVLYSLDTDKMIKQFEEIKKDAPWFLFGNKGNVKKLFDSKKNAYSCSSYVYEILKAGGLFDHLLLKSDGLYEPITPLGVKEIIQKGNEIEHILYPDTQEYFYQTLQGLKKELIEKSKDGQAAVSAFLKENFDFYYLYQTFCPTAYPLLRREVQKNINVAIRTETSQNSLKLLNAVMALNDLNGKRSDTSKTRKKFLNDSLNEYIESLLNREHINLSIKSENGYNALHWAIIKRNYECVEKLLKKFPSSINDEISIDSQQTDFSNVPTNMRFFPSLKTEAISLTPLDLAISIKDKEILDLLQKRGGTASYYREEIGNSKRYKTNSGN